MSALVPRKRLHGRDGSRSCHEKVERVVCEMVERAEPIERGRTGFREHFGVGRWTCYRNQPNASDRNEALVGGSNACHGPAV